MNRALSVASGAMWVVAGCLVQATAVGGGAHADRPSLVAAVARDPASPIVMVCPDGSVVSEALSSIPGAKVYTYVERPEEDGVETVIIEVDDALPGTYSVYIGMPTGGETGGLTVGVERGEHHCGETIDPSGSGMPQKVFVYRFVVELTEGGCSVEALDGQ